MTDSAPPDKKGRIFLIDVTAAVNAAIAILFALVSFHVIPWLKQNTSKQNYDALATLVRAGVQAAEQIFAGAGKGEEKKKFVLKLLSENGYEVDVEAVNAMIEAEVRELEIM
jgi:uncharacterized iron-regulated membrane protein